MSHVIRVAVGVISRGDFVFIAKRPLHVHQGGLWEFPGGKIERDESVEQALARELNEELGIVVVSSTPLITIAHHYTDKSVRLEVHLVSEFSGEPRGAEGQDVKWAHRDELRALAFPAANRAIINALLLPRYYSITGSFDSDAMFTAKMEQVINRGITLVQLRTPKANSVDLSRYISAHRLIWDKHRVQVQINCDVNNFNTLMRKENYSSLGLHLSNHRAALCSQRPVPPTVLFGVSCHNESEVGHAVALEADYLLISPVNHTRSHPDAEPVGWEQFSALAAIANIPCYALGGMTSKDLPIALTHGAQGIAGISEWWD